MAEFKTIAERTVSGKGLLRVPKDEKKRRLVILYGSLVRPPKARYANLNYDPYKGTLAFLTFHRNKHVIDSATMEFESQSWDTVTDITSQNLIAIKCMYEGVLQSFVNLITAMSFTPGGIGIQPISVTDLIKDYEYLDLAWDEVRIKCYADAAINFKLQMLPHDTCDPEKDKPRKPPPPPPPPPKVPPGTPLTDISPPYEDEEDPDDFTEPFEGDASKPPPQGEACVEYDVSIIVYQIVGEPIPLTFRLFGEIGEAGVGLEGRAVYIEARGGRDSLEPLSAACLPEIAQCFVYGSTEPTYSDAEVVNIVQVS